MTYYDWYTWIVLGYVILVLSVGWIFSLIKTAIVFGEINSLVWEYIFGAIGLSVVCAILAFSVINLDAILKKQKSKDGLTEEENTKYLPFFAALTVLMFVASAVLLYIIIKPNIRVSPFTF
jgi:hypothetical protein